MAVISTVNCSASTSKFISDRFRDGSFRRDYPNVDGVFAITHKGGCAMQFDGRDHQTLERVLAGFANHPNVAAYVLVGLGCEVVQRVALGRVARPRDDRRRPRPTAKRVRPRVLNIQDQGGITKTVEAAVEAVHRLLPEANSWTRSDQPASKIHLALECGGSDGNSGVTANPALGVAADLVGRPGRDGHPGRDDRDLRGRAHAHPPGRVAARSARSSSIASSGGSGTPACSVPRSTTTPRPATRPAG